MLGGFRVWISPTVFLSITIKAQDFTLTFVTDSIQPCLQKTNDLLSGQERDKSYPLRCTICGLTLHHPHEATVVCPHESCEQTSHITCLSIEFLRQEASKTRSAGGKSQECLVPISTQVLPVEGRCPSCGKSTQWIDIVKPLTYRLRVKVPEKKERKTRVVKETTNKTRTVKKTNKPRAVKKTTSKTRAVKKATYKTRAVKKTTDNRKTARRRRG